MPNNTEKTEAVIIRNGYPVARTKSAAKNGDYVDYGWETVDDDWAILKIGEGKISRAKKWLGNDELMLSLDYAYVNYGGGEPV